MMSEILDCFDVVCLFCFVFQIVNALDLTCDKPLIESLQSGIFPFKCWHKKCISNIEFMS